ncbi:MAG: glycoside hydrolase family 78 protein [Treponema sp.]|jgi:alpha-L-rhamnosidase|nr:glycoside hydrolase family 78 protein [Treponema sp.]
MLRITDLKIEYQTHPVGIDHCPRFSWILESDTNDTLQSGYKITVSGADGTVWDSGKAASSESVLVEYAGKALAPRTEYRVTVSVWDNHGQTAEAAGSFETGLMGGFKGNWITHGYDDDTEPCPVFIREFSVAQKIKSARLYASALGIYEIALNGHKAGDAFFAPGWTSYRKRLQYQAYDVTALLAEKNRIEITVARGWFSGQLKWDLKPHNYGSRNALWAQLEITFEDGGCETIASDDKWQYGSGPVRYAELYHGQLIDNNISVKAEGSARVFDYPMDALTAQENEPVRVTERLKPARFIRTPKGEQVFDFGQNLTGVVEARLNCPKGTAVTIRHAEVLDKEGNFYTENLRKAKAADTFICSGSGEELFMPAFTFHGFRYIAVEGWGDAPGNASGDAPPADWFTACVLHTDMERTGSFECSHQGISRLQENIRWGQRGNFLDIPTDCPQRDERLGWTGDAQMFASTAAFNYNVTLFFTKWLRDLEADQTAERGVPYVIPDILDEHDGSAAWGDAAAIVPWTLYEVYSDKRLLKQQYNSMKGWVEYIRSKAGNANLWQSGFHYGDWLSLDREAGPNCVGATDMHLIATAFYAYSSGIVAKAAEVLGYSDDAEQYGNLHNNIVKAFQKEYITQTGRMVSETQTACILALHFDLAQPEFRNRVLQNLVSNLGGRNNHLATGFAGTPYLCHVLSENGRHEIAGKIFLQEDYPSWLYAVKMGGTTIWERWNSMEKDGSLGDVSMNSFNHYSYGSIGSWIYQKLSGLSIIEPGYKKSRIAPMPIAGITRAKAVLKTVYGTLSCEWRHENNVFCMDITVPCNTTALVRLPGKDEEFTAGSGTYRYECPYKNLS